MTVVVTGAGGHLGANLIRLLVEKRRKVRAVVRTDKRALEGMDVEIVQADVLDFPSLLKAFDRAEVVYHLAAVISITGGQEGLVERVNVDGPRNVVKACLKTGVRRLIHFSSIHAHPQEPVNEIMDENRSYVPLDHPISYDRTKAEGERQILKGVKMGLDAVIVNPTGVIGPWDFKPSLMGQMFLDLYHRKLIGLVKGGFNWVDARDVALGAMAAEEKGKSGHKYFLSGHWKTLYELASMAQKVTGINPPSFCVPIWLARVCVPFAMMVCNITGRRHLFTSDSLAALRSNRHISYEKANKELGYMPRSIEDTIKAIYDWFKNSERIEL